MMSKPFEKTDPQQKSQSLLGIIGGMGTQATACFYEKLHLMQNVSCEQDYLDILLYSIPSVPDRTAFITGQSSDSPLNSLIRAARTLESAGVSHIAIPCVTSHYFYDDISGAVSIPVINLLRETVDSAIERNVSTVCLFATDGTIKSRILNSAFEKRGINIRTPSDSIQADLMEIIYDIKCGSEISPEVLEPITKQALEDSTEAVVLGCTELCIHAKEHPKVINTLDVLAEAALNNFR